MAAQNPNTAAFLDLMPSSVTVEPFLSSNTFGQASYGPAKTYRAHISNKSVLVRGPEGETIVARGQVWLATSDDIGSKDRVTLPGTGGIIIILNVDAGQDETGVNLYTRLDFG